MLPNQDPDDLRALLACMAANGLVPDIAAVQTVPIAPYVFLQTAAYNGRHAGFVPAGTQVRVSLHLPLHACSCFSVYAASRTCPDAQEQPPRLACSG